MLSHCFYCNVLMFQKFSFLEVIRILFSPLCSITQGDQPILQKISWYIPKNREHLEHYRFIQ